MNKYDYKKQEQVKIKKIIFVKNNNYLYFKNSCC